MWPRGATTGRPPVVFWTPRKVAMGRTLALMYHGFSDTPQPVMNQLFVTSSNLRSQLMGLLNSGWTAIDEDGWLNRSSSLTGKHFFVTIDDGYRSVLEKAAPILSELGVPATVYIPAGCVGGTTAWMTSLPNEPLLDRDEIRELKTFQINIGGHGFDHTSMVGMSEADLVRNTSGARSALGDITGELPSTFAYPYGHHDGAARRAVAKAGYHGAFSMFAGTGPFAQSRVNVTGSDTIASFKLKCAPGYLRIRRMPFLSTVVSNAMQGYRRVRS
jgi:peptidoglycan/xylan/chitin deacetylase (PgdA/CDA1 family)